MTPSKSNTIARSTRSSEGQRLTFAFYPQALADANWNLQTVFRRRERALVAFVVVTVGVERAIEVELVNARPVPIEFDVAATGIGFGAARQIGEHDSEVVEVRRRSVNTCGELQRLTLQD